MVIKLIDFYFIFKSNRIYIKLAILLWCFQPESKRKLSQKFVTKSEISNILNEKEILEFLEEFFFAHKMKNKDGPIWIILWKAHKNFTIFTYKFCNFSLIFHTIFKANYVVIVIYLKNLVENTYKLRFYIALLSMDSKIGYFFSQNKLFQVTTW